MFERFTPEARAVVVAARAEAGGRGEDRLGTEHLLVGLLIAGGPELALLAGRGATLDRVRARLEAHGPTGAGDDLDAEALAAVGIDLDAVRRAAESQFGAGALAARTPRRGSRIRTSRRAKKVLELALREAHRARSSSITARHVLLGILREGHGLAVVVLAETGVDVVALRQELLAADGDGRAA